jgi:flavodoxin
MRTGAILLACAALVVDCACSSTGPDTVSRATAKISDFTETETGRKNDALIILAASENGGTMKIAKILAQALDARIKTPSQVNPDELRDYRLIGFGSPIFSQKHYESLFELADALPAMPGEKAFIFSTSGMSRQFALDHGTFDTHTPLRDKLGAKSLEIVGEFNCAGFNDNSFLKLFGGMNKGKPDAKDLARAKAFAEELKRQL